jgi:hypothetical protein
MWLLRLRRFKDGGNQYLDLKGSKELVDEAFLVLVELDWSPWIWKKLL